MAVKLLKNDFFKTLYSQPISLIIKALSFWIIEICDMQQFHRTSSCLFSAKTSQVNDDVFILTIHPNDVILDGTKPISLLSVQFSWLMSP